VAGKFAVTTDVPIEKTQAEIEALLKKYGATAFGRGWDEEQGVAVISFRLAERHLRIVLPPVDLTTREMNRAADGRQLQEREKRARREQAERSAWRALLLVIKAQLEAVERGIMTLEMAFFPHIVLPNGRTMEQQYTPQIKEAYATGQMPALLPGLKALESGA
jgi:hypothetical protein